MKPKTILAFAAALGLLLSACGPKAIPTIDPAQVQASAVAAAGTMLAMTQEAMPTETPIPLTDTPTDTPQPTPTIPPLPTSPVVIASPTMVVSTGGGGECGGLIKASKGEALATIVIYNKTNVTLGVSLYLNKNSWGDCGFWSTGPSGLGPNSSITITTLPASNSCYHVTAWTLAGSDKFTVPGYFCTGMAGGRQVLVVTTTSVNLR